MEALTFSELRKIQKKERRQEELVELDENFLLRVSDYLSRKEEIGEEREYRSAKRVFDKIISLREDKIVKNARLAANSGVDPSKLDLLPREEEMFRKVKRTFSEHRERIEEEIDGEPDIESIEEESPGVEEEDRVEDEGESYEEVMITSDVPEFMGTDLESYGPFEDGEKAEVPEQNAEILVNRGNAERLD